MYRKKKKSDSFTTLIESFDIYLKSGRGDKKKKKKEKKYSKPIFEHRIVLFIKPSPCNRDTEGIVSFFFRIDKVYSFVRACFVKLLLVKYARLIYR